MTSAIVTSTYRYKRSSKKRKAAVADTLPAIIRIDPNTGRNLDRPKALPADEPGSAIVTPKDRHDRLPVGETDQAAAARYRALIISKLQT